MEPFYKLSNPRPQKHEPTLTPVLPYSLAQEPGTPAAVYLVTNPDPDRSPNPRVGQSRNRALLLVRTSLVLVIDGDLLVQSALRAKLSTGGPDWARMLSEAQVNFRHGGFA